MSRSFFGLFVLAFLAPLAARAGDASCNLPLVYIMKFEMNMDQSGLVSIPASIAGHPENFVVDTGGVTATLTDGAEDVLGLRRQFIMNSPMMLYGNVRMDTYVRTADFKLQNFRFSPVAFATIPAGRLPVGLNGTIAPDFLAQFDIEFDFAADKMVVFSQKHCPDQVVYWTKGPYARLPLTVSKLNQLLITVQLDGKDVLALIDTGSTQSEMSLETAESLFGFDTKSLLLKPGSLLGHYAYRYPFKKLVMQDVRVNNPELTLVPDRDSGDMMAKFDMQNLHPKILLGMDVLRQLHLYIAYKERAIYLTPAEQR